MAFHQALEWHSGETRIHELTGVNRIVGDNPSSSFLTPRAAHMAARYPLLALGTTCTNPETKAEEISCTVWGGFVPVAQQIAPSVLGVRAQVDTRYDPVVEALFGGKCDGEVLKEEGEGRMVAGLSISLDERGRVKLAGRVVAGACSRHSDENQPTPAEEIEETSKSTGTGAGDAQLVVRITQSLGNCPKYLNRKTITPATPQPELLESGTHLGPKSRALIEASDLFFIASAHAHEDMDCNHRGGPPGFLRATTTTTETPSNNTQVTQLIYPEYSGNNLYQTLGNLMTTPSVGICIPSFSTGDVLYISGTAEVLVGAAASAVIAQSSLAVRVTVTSSRYVSQGLPFCGTPIPVAKDKLEGRSPYNPRVRYLTTEKSDPLAKEAGSAAPATASLIKKEKITPTVNRYRFALEDPAVLGPWRPGQYVALDFSGELDMGYSHMRDEDPGSLNDDYVRNFTVSSVPGGLGVHGEEFEVMVRRVGRVTEWLGWQREGLVELGVRGFGGEFRFELGEGEGGKVGFVCAGIGVTPLLGQKGVDVGRLRVLWSLGVRDVGLVKDVLGKWPELGEVMVVFLSGDEEVLDDEDRKVLEEVKSLAKVERRRIQEEDVVKVDGEVDEWYLCTAPAMRQEVQSWLPNRAIVFENFDY